MYKNISLLLVALLILACSGADSGKVISLEVGERNYTKWQDTVITPAMIIDSVKALSNESGEPIIEFHSSDSMGTKYLNYITYQMKEVGVYKLELNLGKKSFPLIILPDDLENKSVKQIQQLAVLYVEPDTTLFLRATAEYPLQSFNLENLVKVLTKGISQKPDLGVAIDLSNRVTYGRLIELITSIQAAGVKYIVFPTYNAYIYFEQDYRRIGLEDIEKSFCFVPVTTFTRFKRELKNPEHFQSKNFRTMKMDIRPTK